MKIFLLAPILIWGLNSSAQTTIVKQPNCNEIKGLQTCDNRLIPENYTGIMFCCLNGKVKELRNYKNDKIDGFWMEWFENGQLKSEVNFKDGEFDGISRTWYENGQLSSEANYKVGKYEGLVRSWFENGQLSQEENYKNGLQDGLMRWWYESGKLYFEGNYIEDKHDGLSRRWHENGQKDREWIYKDGELISETCWDENGNLIKCQD